MNAFKKLRFPKISLTLFIIGALVLIAIPIRISMGASINLPDDGAWPDDVIFQGIMLPILIIGIATLLLSLLLWLLLRKKGFRFLDLNYPIGTLGAIAIFVLFHIVLLS